MTSNPYPNEDLYDILGVDSDAEMSEINTAYKKMALKYHPDKNPGSEEAVERFKQVKFAHEVLSSYKRRKEYDQHQSGVGSITITTLPNLFGSFFTNFDPFGFGPDLDFDTAFEKALKHHRGKGPHPMHSSAFVSSSSYQRGPDGKVKTTQHVETNLDGKQRKYQYRQTQDKKGRVIEKQGSPIPYKTIKNEMKDYWQTRPQLTDERYPQIEYQSPEKKVHKQHKPHKQHRPHRQISEESRSPVRSGNIHHPVQSRKTVDPFKYQEAMEKRQQTKAKLAEQIKKAKRKEVERQRKQQKDRGERGDRGGRGESDEGGFNPLKWIDWD